jgi:hypothetical protein
MMQREYCISIREHSLVKPLPGTVVGEKATRAFVSFVGIEFSGPIGSKARKTVYDFRCEEE